MPGIVSRMSSVDRGARSSSCFCVTSVTATEASSSVRREVDPVTTTSSGMAIDGLAVAPFATVGVWSGAWVCGSV